VLNRLLSPASVLLVALLSASPAAAAADSAAPPPAPPTPESAVSSTDLIVQWTHSARRSDKAEARDDADVTVEHGLGDARFQLLSVEHGQPIDAAIDSLEANPAVALAEPDSYSAPNAIPDDPLFGQLWGLRNLGGPGVNGFSGAVKGDDIDALGAWNRTVGTPSTVIADLDTGYRFEHPDLESVAWTNLGEIPGNDEDDDNNGFVDDVHGADFVGPNSDVTPVVDGDPTDEDLLSGGHGVHTAGTMGAAGDNGVGITGVAQDIRIMPLRVCSRSPSEEESRCPVSSQIAAINYAADEGARVANMSLGGLGFNQAEVNAFAANPQTLFVISAGNDGQDNDSIHHYPCDYTPQTQASPSVPGAIDNIICVAATDQADGLASFSDWGTTSVDIGAPGTETLSTYPFATPLNERFTIDDFASQWPATGADGGFERTDESPLTSFGMTDAVGAPAANTERETTSAPVTFPANSGCKLNQTRRVSLATGDEYRYSVLLNGIEKTGSSPPSTATPGLERRFLELPASFNAGGEVQVRFRFEAGSAPAEGSGVWLDDISIVCVQGIGQADSYGFLQGTSMAAPHVTGAAALLFSRMPSATVTEVKDALLSGADPVPSLAGKTASQGRLNASKAMDVLEGIGEPVDEEPPAAPELTSTDPASPANENHPKIVGSAEGGSTIKIYSDPACEGAAVETGTAEELGSAGIAVTVPDDSVSEFSATATDEALNTSACSTPPIKYEEHTPSETEIVKGPPDEAEEAAEALRKLTQIVVPPTTPATPVCTVPRLARKTLARARVALAAAHCALGKVKRPRAPKGRRLGPLVVKSSTPSAAASPASGTVDLTLAVKPKPKKKSHH